MITCANACAAILLAAFAASAAEVRVAVFGLFHPREVQVTRVAGDEFILSVPGRIQRHYRGRLEIVRDGDEVIPIVTMSLETAVSSIVAAESPPGAGIESLKAQAVVTRSFLLAARGRHAHADFCDTTHCQFLREPPAARSLAAQAARETAGVALEYQGRVIAALYSADCGGSTLASHTGAYPYFAVACPARDGRVAGHRLGLCQRGSAVMARDGATWMDILRRYYPAAGVTWSNRGL